MSATPPPRSWLISPLIALTMLACACSSGGQGGDVAKGGSGGTRSGGGDAQVTGSGGQVAPGGSTSVQGGTVPTGTPSTGGRAGASSLGGREPGSSGVPKGGVTTGAGGTSHGGTVSSGGRAGAGGGTSTAGSVSASGGTSTGGTVTGSVASGATAGTGTVGSGGITTGGASSRTGGVNTGGVSGGTNGTAGTGGSSAVRLTWTNPLVPQRADPHVLLHSDGHYYLTATVPEYDRIELRRAPSLGGLATAQAKVVWRKHASGEMGAHIWAPEIHFIDGAWYIYFTAGRSSDVWAVRMYALKNVSANPLEGEWTELGKIATNWDSFSLDATTFELEGQRYYLWTQTVPNYPGTSILIARMSSPTKLTGAQVVITSPRNTWETRGHEVNEAPAVLVKNGRVFVAYSASATDQNYCMGLLTADAGADLLDAKSWKKSPQPVFQTNAQNSQYGPGHNSFTTSPDGKIDILVYHARKYRDIVGEPLNNPDRATRAQRLSFDAAGLPVFGVPVADGPYQIDLP